MGRYSAWILGVSVFVLSTLGLIMLTSTSIWTNEGDGQTYSHLYKQATWMGIGLVAAVMAALFDYRRLEKYWLHILIACCVLLAFCFVPGFGQERNGETRWIKLPGLPQFQPSECAKIVVALSLAAFIAKYQAEIGTFKRGFVFPCLILGAPVGLIFFETDMGTAVSLGAAGFCLLFVAGTRLKYLAFVAVSGASGLAYMVHQNANRMERFTAFLDLEAHRLDKGLQQYRALLAFANGGVEGLGLGNGAEKHGYLPYAHTDFIFAMVGEEMGMWWTLGTVFCFVLITICGVSIAINATDLFSKLFAVGLVATIVVPAMVNIAVVTALLPNTGLPLPFLSYGGTNLVFTFAAIGFLVSIHRHTKRAEISEIPLIKERKLAIRI